MKTKILYFNEKWTSGGAEAFVMNLIRNLNSNEFEASILTTQSEWDGFDEELEYFNINKYSILKKPIYNPFFRVFKTIYILGKTLEDLNIDIIHLNIFNGVGLIYAYIARKKKIPIVIVHSHNTDIIQSKFKFLKMFAHLICKYIFSGYPTYYYGCSEKAIDFICPRRYRSQSKMIPNAIEMEKFYFNDFIRKKKRNELKISDEIIIGNIGRLNVQKNHKFLLDIFAELRKENHNIKLCIAGSGELKDELKKKAIKLGISDHIIWYGTSNKINELYQAFDVFVMTSKFEGLPIVLLEAQVADLPCIVSDIIDPKSDLLEGRNIKRISLNSDKIIWAKEIQATFYRNHRINLNKMLENNDFNIKNAIKNIEKNYKILIGGEVNGQGLKN